MSLMLAPYNDSMRLGMGYNSYTQTMCIDRAVTFSHKQVKTAENPSQVVTYSSRCVNKLSDIVKSMNVSYSTSIKKGTVEVAGSSNTINEDKIKESDINAVVSVKVVNQTTIVDETCTFQGIKGILPGTPDFNDRFGDCYISGFIEGGDFNGIISMRVLNRNKVDQVTAKVKQSLNYSAGASSKFTLDVDSFTTNTTSSDVGNETESTVSVAWMGGGQIKDAAVPWDKDSVYAAAAAFPAYVAQTPQKTWAILTKYKANRSFVEWSSHLSFSPLEYDSIASYTAELFDNYMEYKQLSKLVEDMIANPANYIAQTWKTNAIPVSVPTLLAVKAAFRIEMSKIVQAVDILSKDPHALRRSTGMDAEPADELVRRIVRQAQEGDIGSASNMTSSIPQRLPPVSTSPPAAVAPAVVPAAATAATSPEPETTVPDSVVTVPAAGSATDAPSTLGTTEPSVPSAASESSFVAVEPVDTSAPVQTSSDTRSPDILDPRAMVAPEIWSDLLPSQVDPAKTLAASDTISTMPSSLAHFFPPAPENEIADLKDRGGQIAVPKDELEIVAAVCGVVDVASTLRKMIKDNKLSFQGSAIKGLVANRTQPPSDYPICLQFIYRYGKGPMRLCAAKTETSNGSNDTTKTYTITPDTTEFPTIQPTPWNADTWSITAFVYGAKLYADENFSKKAQDVVRRNYDGGKGIRSLGIPDNNFVGEDIWPGSAKTAVVFFQAIEDGPICATVAFERKSPAVMSEKLTTGV